MEFKDDNGRTVRRGILADWELSKYKEYMNMGLGPRQPDRTVRSIFLAKDGYAHDLG